VQILLRLEIEAVCSDGDEANTKNEETLEEVIVT